MDKGSPVPSEPSAPIQQITVNPATQMRRLFHRANRLQTVAQTIIRCRKNMQQGILSGVVVLVWVIQVFFRWCVILWVVSL